MVEKSAVAEKINVLLNSLYSKADYDVMFKKAAQDQSLFTAIWEIAKEKPENESWRIVWILDHATEKKNGFIFPILDELHERVLKSNNESFIRLCMKLILRCPVNEDYAGELLERCVEWMNNPKAKVSSQGLGLEYFYRVCQLYPEMTPELLAHIDNMLENRPSAGMKIRLKQIRKKIGE